MSSSSLTSNPKQAHRVTKYNPNLQRSIAAAAAVASATDKEAAEAAQMQDEPPADWLSLASLILGVLGLMMRYKLCAWLALFCCMSSIANMRKKDMDFKQVFCSILFATMGTYA